MLFEIRRLFCYLTSDQFARERAQLLFMLCSASSMCNGHSLVRFSWVAHTCASRMCASGSRRLPAGLPVTRHRQTRTADLTNGGPRYLLGEVVEWGGGAEVLYDPAARMEYMHLNPVRKKGPRHKSVLWLVSSPSMRENRLRWVEEASGRPFCATCF